MFDLVALDHTRVNNFPDDVSEYISENNSLIKLIRLSKSLAYTDFEFNKLIDYINKKP